MTEIRIEKKRTVWPWILLAMLLAALVIYLVFFRADKKEDPEVNDVALVTVQENNAIVADFVAFVRQDTGRMTLNHHYTSQAILKLTNAVNAMAAEIGFDVKQDIEKVKAHADAITQDPLENTHAEDIKEAADILSNSLQRIQLAKYPELFILAEELEVAVSAIDPAVLTLQQREAVKGFLDAAANLLEKMN